MPAPAPHLYRPPASDGGNISGYSTLLSQNKTGSTSTSTSHADNPKLVKAAHEFEASLMQELLKPLLPGQNSLDEEDESGSNSALSSFAGEALGKALSEEGGFGIATRILQQLSATSNHFGKTPVLKQNRALSTKAAGQ